MSSWLMAAFFTVIFLLLFWVATLRAKIADLQQEIQKRREWHQRQLDKTRERI